MSANAKARIAGTIVLVLMLWPLAHRQLVVRYDVNPWKLFGFAMYVTPHSVAVDLIDTGVRPAREIPREALPLPLRDQYDRFVERRRTLGALAPPDELGRAVLEAFPGTERLSVAVTVVQLPFASGTLAARTTFHRFTRQ